MQNVNLFLHFQNETVRFLLPVVGCAQSSGNVRQEQYLECIELTFFIDKKGERMYLTVPSNGESAIETVKFPCPSEGSSINWYVKGGESLFGCVFSKARRVSVEERSKYHVLSQKQWIISRVV